MKKIILFTLLFLQISFLSAQSLVVTGDTEYYGDVNVGGHTIVHYLDVTNTSNNTIEVLCQRTIIGTLPPGLPSWGGASYCFATFCYSSSSPGLSQSVDINSGDTLFHYPTDADVFVGYYDAEGINTVTDVEYRFYDANNPSDVTSITITYNVTGILASVTNTTSGTVMDFYPNPAEEYTTISHKSDENSHLKIIDILGNQVKDIHLSNVGKEDIYVGDLSKGIYFGNLVNNNKVMAIKKLIVK